MSGPIYRVKAQIATKLQRIFRLAPKVKSGPGKGLRFDGGPDTQRFSAGDYERPVQSAIASIICPGDVCYDVGANLGFFSLLCGRFAGPNGAVYAFEPVPKNAGMIERNAHLNSLNNIKVWKIALSRVNGQGELLLARHVGGAVLKGAGVPPDLEGHLMVEIRTVDSLIEAEQIPPPNFVKIDVEGAEMDVLQGMENALMRYAPAVLAELDDETVTRCERKVSLCESFLQDLGYRTQLLSNAYPDGRWFVRHFIARRPDMAMRAETSFKS
jgi:FkbM family methyltransferase